MTEAGATRRLAASGEGLRRFEPGRDLPAVVDLMQEGFEGDLEERDRQWLEDLARLSEVAGPVMTWIARWVPPIAASLKGFVWIEGGRVVANASIMRGVEGVWVIANVVTLPEYRRKGIATMLVDASIDAARAGGAREIQLQVRDDNAPARELYAGMGFRTLFSTAYLRRPAVPAARGARERTGALGHGGRVTDGRVPGAPDRSERNEEWSVAAVRASDRRAVERLVRRADPSGAAVAAPVRELMHRTGAKAVIEDWLFGRRSLSVAARSGAEILGIAVARVAVDGDGYQAGVVIDPAWRGCVEGEVVRSLMAAIDRERSPAVDAEVDVRETAALETLEAVGFHRRKTLDRLGLTLR